MAGLPNPAMVVGTRFTNKNSELRRLDLRDRSSIECFLEREKPVDVLMPAARASVEYCEEHPDTSFAVNARAPELIAEICARVGCRLTVFSTDYVFDGANGPYEESAPTCPINVYGAHKEYAEKAVMSASKDNLVVRTSLVIGKRDDDAGFVQRILRSLARTEPVTVSSEHFSTPTGIRDLVRGTLRLVESNASGIRHVVGPETLSRFAIARRIAAKAGLDEEIIVATSEAGVGLRPKRSGLVASTETRLIIGSAHRLEDELY